MKFRMSYIQKTTSLPLLATLLLASLSLTALSACNRVPNSPTTPGSTQTGSQSQGKITYKVRFELPTTRPDYIARIRKAEIRLTPASGAAVTDSFDFSPTAQTQSIERSLEAVSTGSVSAEIKFFDADGKEVVTALKSSFSLNASSAPLLVKLEATPVLVAPTVSATTGLSALLTQRGDLLDEIQRLSQRESQLLSQLAGLRSSQTLEDQQMKQQLQSELQVTQTNLRAKESALAQLETQIGGVQAQGSGNSNADAATQAQLSQLRLEAARLSSEIDSQLEQRRQLTQEANSRINLPDQGTRLTLIQGELQTLEQQMQANISKLQVVSLQLQQLEAKLSSQSSGVPSAQRKAQIEASLNDVNAQIDELNTAITELKRRIAPLEQETDLQLVQRRETLQAELSQKQDQLAQAQSLKLELEKQLQSLN